MSCGLKTERTTTLGYGNMVMRFTASLPLIQLHSSYDLKSVVTHFQFANGPWSNSINTVEVGFDTLIPVWFTIDISLQSIIQGQN